MTQSRRNWTGWLQAAIAFLVVLAVGTYQPALAQTLSVIHNFTGSQDGAVPQVGLTMDPGGNLYGTASQGGSAGHGSVFRLRFANSGWIFTPLYGFQGGTDGAAPLTRVILGADGTLYGTTARGGNTGCNITCGTVFHLKPPATACRSALCGWTETVLYRFSGGSDGYYPIGDLVSDQAGNIYGTTEMGGPGSQGTVYQLQPSGGGWTESVLYSFPGGRGDGYLPASGVVLDKAGNLYGTTYYGGAFGPGTAYQLSPSGSGRVETVIHDFQGADDGGNPVAGLIFDPSNNLYGATTTGGLNGGGSVFMMTQSGSAWTLSALYGLAPGTGPYGSLTMDAAGNLYGTTFSSGLYGYGSVFKLTPSGGGWTYTSLHDFTGGSDGGNPWGNVTPEANGKLYGTASGGGANGLGVVWEITP